MFLFVTFCYIFILVLPAYTCTVFKKSEGNNVLFGNVENEDPAFVYEIHFSPPDDSKGYFGNFFIKGSNGYVAGGMNDHGLCFDVAGLPNHTAYNGKPNGDLMHYLLNECATIDEALDFFENYYWPGHNVNHIMIMDNTGKSVVVEIIESTLYVFYKTNGAQVMTNFALADPEIRLGDYPCPRFENASNMLDSMQITVENFQKVCEKVSHAYYNSLYGNIYNPVTLQIHFFNANKKGSEITTFNLLDELENGSHYYLLKNNEILLATSNHSTNQFSVSQNFPNPFHEKTSFLLNLNDNARVSIAVYNSHGRMIELIENSQLQSGEYTFAWLSSGLPKGLYLCRINAAGIIETRKWLKY